MATRRRVLQQLSAGALTLMSSSTRTLSQLFNESATPASAPPGGFYLTKVNCGGPAAEGFLADQAYRPGSWGYTHGGQYFECDSVSQDYGIPTVLKTLRYSCGAPFHYKFDVPNGSYRIKMYFVSPNEFYGQRIFDVILNGRVVLAGFHPSPTNTGFLQQCDNIPVSEGQIDITFRSINDACLINAIEVEQTSLVEPHNLKAKAEAGSATFPRTMHDSLIVSYYGSWDSRSNSHRSNTPGSGLDFTFKGSSVHWIGSKGPDHGIAEIYLDGVLQTTVDSYAPHPSSDEILYARTGLSQKQYHTFRLLVSKDKRSSSSGTHQDVIAFDSEHPLDAAEWNAESAFQEVAVIEARGKSYPVPSRWHPAPYAAVTPETGVTLENGALYSAFQRNVSYQVNNWEMKSSWTTWLPGANEGRRMAAAANILRWVDDPALRGRLNDLVDSIASRQRLDGYALPYPDSDMGKVVYGANNERKPYDRRNFALGLIAAGRTNASAIQLARKFQDWLYSSPYINTMLDGALGIMGDQPNLSMYFSSAGKEDDVVVREKYWRQDWWLDQLKDQQPSPISRFPLNRAHSYVVAAWISTLDAYRATGDRTLIDAMLGAWQTYRDNFLHVGGSAAICEDCDNAYPAKSYYLDKHTGENCGGALWIDFNHRLLQLYPEEEKFASEIEQTLYNVTLANQDANGNIRYHTNLVGIKDEAKAICTCCEVTNTTILAQLPGFLYSIAGDGPYINMYTPSSLKWKHAGNDMTIHTSANFPHDPRVSIKILAPRPVPMKVRLRMPSWASTNIAVEMNGQKIIAGRPGTFLTIDRTWSNDDTVSFTLPMEFRLTKYTGFSRDADRDRYALQYGSLLMSLVGDTHLALAPENLIGGLAPAAGSPLQFGIAGHATSKYLPYFQIQSEKFTSFPTLG
jgi:hypothetical protein